MIEWHVFRWAEHTFGEAILSECSIRLPLSWLICRSDPKRANLFRGRKINLCVVFSDQHVGFRELADKTWLVSFMYYDWGFFDEEQNQAEKMGKNPYALKLSPSVQRIVLPLYPVLAKGKWWAHQDSNLGQTDYESATLTNWVIGPLYRAGFHGIPK